MDMAAILFNGAEPFEQIGNTLLTEGDENAIFRQEEIKKLQNFIRVYCPGTRADNPKRIKLWL